jgi:DNA adenine methylase
VIPTSPEPTLWPMDQSEDRLPPNGELSTIELSSIRLRAQMPLATEPRPFLRWAGSKRALLHHIIDLLPSAYRTYREPFLGSGSLFFLLQPARAVLSDSCVELIDTFKAVRDGIESIITYLTPLTPSKETYYAIRSNRSSDHLERAAELIYLNKTCWNGLYRVNSRGEFNVPYGAPKSDGILDASNLRACSHALQPEGVSLRAGDFEEMLNGVEEGDLVFLDPPYVTHHNDNGFIDYNEKLFSWQDQIRLAKLATRLSNQGAHVIVTNAYHGDVLDLYDSFNKRPIERLSTLASDASKRGQVREAVLWRTTGDCP